MLEQGWVRHVRSLAKKQLQTIVDGSITEDNHVVLRRGDQSEIDIGVIKESKPEAIVYVGWDQYNGYDIFTSTDADTWTQSGLDYPAMNTEGTGANTGCWTGDRFLLSAPHNDAKRSVLLQSKGGTSWSTHPDRDTFSDTSEIFSIDATQRGFVVAVGSGFGVTDDGSVAISQDFGQTWSVLPNDPAVYPFSGTPLYGVCVKNEFEWLVKRYTFGVNIVTDIWYTNDGGGNWSPVSIPSEFQPYVQSGLGTGMRYFKSHWWLYGDGSGSGEWDTPLIKSEDLMNWIPVVTVWSGTYQPHQDWLMANLGITHNDHSGKIQVLEYDPRTNTIMATGNSPVTQSIVMFSPDGGDKWIELGHVDQDYFRTTWGFDGIYNWVDEGFIAFLANGALLCLGDSWLVTNGSDGWNRPIAPNMLKIDLDGQNPTAIRLRTELFHDGHTLLSNRDTTEMITDG